MEFEPYAPPSTPFRDARPRVILWYRIYAAAVTIVMLAAFVASTFVAVARSQAAGNGPANAELDLLIMLALFGSFSMLVFYGVAVLVPMKPWGWSIGLVAIGLGIPSLWVIVAIPLLVFWIDPKVKAAFGRL